VKSLPGVSESNVYAIAIMGLQRKEIEEEVLFLW
jgi:hypothetical protein